MLLPSMPQIMHVYPSRSRMRLAILIHLLVEPVAFNALLISNNPALYGTPKHCMMTHNVWQHT